MSRPCPRVEHDVHRRTFLRGVLAGAATTVLGGVGTAGGSLGLASEVPAADQLRRERKRALFIWLAGGASQFEMWDPKPGRDTGGPFRSIATRVAGYHVSELMPQLADRMDKLAVVRSLNTEISAHEQAADLISTGRPKEAALEYPEIGVVLSNELAVRDSELPDYVSMFLSSEGRRRPETGFLGGYHAPLLLEESLRPRHIDLPAGLSEAEHQQREHLRELLSSRFARRRAGEELVSGYNAAYRKVRGLMRADKLFDLEQEPAADRERYGRTAYGEQCLLARRLLEAGVPMVKVARGFWDSHHDNFESHRELVPDFDHVTSVLLDDLQQRGLLDSTLVIILSEFGRTPEINKDVGRDHYAAAWSFALAGCGVRGGTVVGKTDEDGRAVVDGQADAADVAATIYQALGIDPEKHYYVGPRPVPLAKEGARPIPEVLL
ncbi:MAG: DUF1501 domain-containing protein [Pirellulaceae bacterium]|nr:DUF1501 domain-containing protein [Pirellulaceae bacterium]